jgi:hypothetical protein
MYRKNTEVIPKRDYRNYLPKKPPIYKAGFGNGRFISVSPSVEGNGL